MPPFDFPSPPTVGQIVIGPNNTQYQWDGTKWVTVVNAAAGGGVTISDTAPINPIIGRLWFDSVGLQTYIWYTDPTSSQWTPVINQGGLLTDAPSNGTLYGRMNGAWAAVPPVTGVYLPLTGGTLTGQLNITAPNVAQLNIAPTTGNLANITLSKPAGATWASIVAENQGSMRWQMTLGDTTAESGSNAGSNFSLANYADNGNQIGTALSINRATGNATFNNLITSQGLNFARSTVGSIQYRTGGNWIGWDWSGSQLSYTIDGNPLVGIVPATGGTFTGQITINTAPNTGWQVPLLVEDSSLAVGSGMYIGLGLGWSNYSVGYMCFVNNGGTGSTSNYTQFGVLGNNGITVDGAGNCTATGNLHANGNTVYLGGSGQGAISANGAPGLNIGTGTSGNLASIQLYANTTVAQGDISCYGHMYGNYVSGGAPQGQYCMYGYYQNGAWYNAERLGVAVNGTQMVCFYNNGGTTVGWNTNASDRRLKSNLKPAGDALDIVKHLPVYDLDYNSGVKSTLKGDRAKGEDWMPDSEPEHWSFSLIADEVAAVLPHAAGRGFGDDSEYWVSVNPQHLVSVLWKAVQQLSAELDALKAKVGAA